jgi:hypothetical protein
VAVVELFGCSNLVFVLYNWIGNVGGWNIIRCHLFQFKTGALSQVLCYLSVSPFYGPTYWCVSIMCTEHLPLVVLLFGEECVQLGH